MPNRGRRNFLDNIIPFSAFSGATIGAGTVDSSGVGMHTARARIMQIFMVAGPPGGGTPTVQAKWQSTPNSPFVFIDVPGGTGPVITHSASGALYIARFDVDFMPKNHSFLRLRFIVAGAGTFNFQGIWLCEDLDQEPPAIYDLFPSFRPTEIVTVDSTNKGTNG